MYEIQYELRNLKISIADLIDYKYIAMWRLIDCAYHVPVKGDFDTKWTSSDLQLRSNKHVVEYRLAQYVTVYWYIFPWLFLIPLCCKAFILSLATFCCTSTKLCERAWCAVWIEKKGPVEGLQRIFIVIRLRLVLRTVSQLLVNTAYRIRHNHSSFPYTCAHLHS